MCVCAVWKPSQRIFTMVKNCYTKCNELVFVSGGKTKIIRTKSDFIVFHLSKSSVLHENPSPFRSHTQHHTLQIQISKHTHPHSKKIILKFVHTTMLLKKIVFVFKFYFNRPPQFQLKEKFCLKVFPFAYSRINFS